MLLVSLFHWGAAGAQHTSLKLSLQTRSAEGKPLIEREKLEPTRVGVVVVDMWNHHWCKTATMRVDVLVPRMNRVLDVVREMGMTVMLCPSDVVDNYAGWPLLALLATRSRSH